MMLTVVKGPATYDEIRKIGDIQFDTFRDACFAMGFLEYDQEYIGAIKEVNGVQVIFFANFLSSCFFRLR